MEALNRLVILYDYYGELLTDKQQDVFDLYYFNDLSLGEIAEITNTSRQAVHDMVRRTQCALENYEETLGIVGRFFKLENSLQQLRQDLMKLEPLLAHEGKKILKDIYKKLDAWIKEGGECDGI